MFTICYQYLSVLIDYWVFLIPGGLFTVDSILEVLWGDYRRWLDRYLSQKIRRKLMIGIALAGVFVAGFLAWKDEHEQVVALQQRLSSEAGRSAAQHDTVAFVRVTKEGGLSSRSNLERYGLSVEKVEFGGGPAYLLTFEQEPEHFKVISEDAADAHVVNIGQRKYRVQFVGFEVGQLLVESDFMVFLYPLNM